MRNAIEISKLLNQFTRASEKKYGGTEYATGYFESQIAHLFTLVDEKTQNVIVSNLLQNISQFNDNCNPPSNSWTSFSSPMAVAEKKADEDYKNYVRILAI
jgi:hypothetical protein